MEYVPDMHALLDHPVARPLAAAQPPVMPVDRAVAARPGRPRLDERPQLAAADQLDPLAIPWIRTALEPDVNDQTAALLPAAISRSQPSSVIESGFSA